MQTAKGKVASLKKDAKHRALKQARLVPGCEKAISKIYARAVELRKWFNVAVDHIIPLAKGGLHFPDNLQIIYANENWAKGARLDFQPTIVFR